MEFLSVTPGSLSVTNEIAKRDFTYVRTYGPGLAVDGRSKVYLKGYTFF